jgi:hypothetical protein
MGHIHSPDTTVIIASFENAIRLGHTLLILLKPCYEHQRFVDVDLFYFRLRSLWLLCTTVGATLCSPENVLTQGWEKHLYKDLSWICERLLANPVEKLQQAGLPAVTDAAYNGHPAPSAARLEVVEKLARKINKEQGLDVEATIHNLSLINFKFQLEEFED